MPRPRTPPSPFRYFNSSPEVIRLVVMMYVRFPLSLRNVEDLLFERGIDLAMRRCATGGTGSAGTVKANAPALNRTGNRLPRCFDNARPDFTRSNYLARKHLYLRYVLLHTTASNYPMPARYSGERIGGRRAL